MCMCTHIISTCGTVFLFINYCFDMFRPQFLSIIRELVFFIIVKYVLISSRIPLRIRFFSHAFFGVNQNT